MTGFEYITAMRMLCEGQSENGLKSISNILNSYDRLKRGPFDEVEYGLAGMPAVAFSGIRNEM